MIYARENNTCYFFRKPAGLPSTRGKQQCFLDSRKNGSLTNIYESLTSNHHTHRSLIDTQIAALGLTVIEFSSYQDIISSLLVTFSQEQEYGLLNRLDTPTSGLLYFAKNQNTYNQRPDRQKNGLISKYYIAEIGKKIPYMLPYTISTPLAHHKNGLRMIAATPEFLSGRRKQKIKGKLLPAKTRLVQDLGNGRILIQIHKGWRHQIRVHMASIGLSLVGDQLYGESEDGGMLGLWSVGAVVEKD